MTAFTLWVSGYASDREAIESVEELLAELDLEAQTIRARPFPETSVIFLVDVLARPIEHAASKPSAAHPQ
jgi:hypothetical protein